MGSEDTTGPARAPETGTETGYTHPGDGDDLTAWQPLGPETASERRAALS